MQLKYRLVTFVALPVLILAIESCIRSDNSYDQLARRTDDAPPIEEIVRAPVTVDEIQSALARDFPPDIEYAINEVKKSRFSYEVSKLLACAYTRCDERNENWHPVIYENSLIRVNLLDVLVQAQGQGIDFSHGHDFRSDAIVFLVDENPLVVQRALLILSFIANPKDIPSMEDVALTTPNDTTFRVAILALKLMSSEKANDAIQRIWNASDAPRREIVSDFVE